MPSSCNRGLTDSWLKACGLPPAPPHTHTHKQGASNSPKRTKTQARMAMRAPRLKLTGSIQASGLQDMTWPSSLQLHTWMVSVPVLLSTGSPLSAMRMGRQKTLCSCCRKPDLLVRIRAVLSKGVRHQAIKNENKKNERGVGSGSPTIELVSWIEESRGGRAEEEERLEGVCTYSHGALVCLSTQIRK